MNIGVETHLGSNSRRNTDTSQQTIDFKLKNSTPKSLKDLDAFDLSSLNSLLPPNTGPPGTVNINSGGTNSNKNLSHVPCKFFRQGICQAGSSCPFSHNLDGSLGADALPCKYFQKGNCKFGLKCALAHFLPDGTRINSKSFMNNMRDKKNNNGNGNGHSNSMNGSNTSSKSHGNHLLNYMSNVSATSNPMSFNGFHSDPIDIGSYNQSITPPNKPMANFMAFSSQSRISSNNLATINSKYNSPMNGSNSNPISLSVDVGSNSFHSVPNYTSNAFSNSYSNSTFGFANNNSGTHTSVITPNSLLNSSNSQPNSAGGGLFRSYSSATSPTVITNQSNSPQQSNFFNQKQFISHSPTNMNMNSGTSFGSFSKSLTSNTKFHSGSFSSYLNSLDIHESAIIDDEDQGKDTFYEEDYVPASLGDIILTPQEMQGRDSRSQSGTLLVRPNLSSNAYDHDKSITSNDQDNSQIDIDNDIDNSFQKLGNDVVFLME